MKVNRKRIISLFIGMLLILCMLTGCGNASKSSVNQPVNSSDVATDGFYVDESYAKEDKEFENNFVNQKDENQKLIYTGNITIKCDDIVQTYDNLQKKMTEVDARFESINEYRGDKTMIIRVPKAQFMDFVNSLNGIGGEIVSSNISATDKTNQFLDNEHRIDILETEYNEIKALMDRATNIEEIMQIRDRLSEITYELESLQGYNKQITYDSDYAKLTITLSKVYVSSTESPSFSIQIKEAFNDGIYALRIFVLGLIRIWWLLLIVAAVIVLIVRKVKTSNRRKYQPTAQNYAKPNTTVTNDNKSTHEEKNVTKS